MVSTEMNDTTFTCESGVLTVTETSGRGHNVDVATTGCWLPSVVEIWVTMASDVALEAVRLSGAVD